MWVKLECSVVALLALALVIHSTDELELIEDSSAIEGAARVLLEHQGPSARSVQNADQVSLFGDNDKLSETRSGIVLQILSAQERIATCNQQLGTATAEFGAAQTRASDSQLPQDFDKAEVAMQRVRQLKSSLVRSRGELNEALHQQAQAHDATLEMFEQSLSKRQEQTALAKHKVASALRVLDEKRSKLTLSLVGSEIVLAAQRTQANLEAAAFQLAQERVAQERATANASNVSLLALSDLKEKSSALNRTIRATETSQEDLEQLDQVEAMLKQQLDLSTNMEHQLAEERQLIANHGHNTSLWFCSTDPEQHRYLPSPVSAAQKCLQPPSISMPALGGLSSICAQELMAELWLTLADRFTAFARQLARCSQPQLVQLTGKLVASLNDYSHHAWELQCPREQFASLSQTQAIMEKVQQMMSGLTPAEVRVAKLHLQQAKTQLAEAVKVAGAARCHPKQHAAVWECSASGLAHGGTMSVTPQPAAMWVQVRADAPTDAEPRCIAEFSTLLANRMGEAMRALSWKTANSVQAIASHSSTGVLQTNTTTAEALHTLDQALRSQNSTDLTATEHNLSGEEQMEHAFATVERIRAVSLQLHTNIQKTLSEERNAKAAALRALMDDKRTAEVAVKEEERTAAAEARKAAIEKIALAQEIASKDAEKKEQLAVKEKDNKAMEAELEELAENARLMAAKEEEKKELAKRAVEQKEIEEKAQQAIVLKGKEEIKLSAEAHEAEQEAAQEAMVTAVASKDPAAIATAEQALNNTYSQQNKTQEAEQEAAKEALDAAIASKDPAAIATAEQEINSIYSQQNKTQGAAKEALDAAVASEDPAAIVAAEQGLDDAFRAAQAEEASNKAKAEAAAAIKAQQEHEEQKQQEQDAHTGERMKKVNQERRNKADEARERHEQIEDVEGKEASFKLTEQASVLKAQGDELIEKQQVIEQQKVKKAEQQVREESSESKERAEEQESKIEESRKLQEESKAAIGQEMMADRLKQQAESEAESLEAELKEVEAKGDDKATIEVKIAKEAAQAAAHEAKAKKALAEHTVSEDGQKQQALKADEQQVEEDLIEQKTHANATATEAAKEAIAEIETDQQAEKTIKEQVNELNAKAQREYKAKQEKGVKARISGVKKARLRKEKEVKKRHNAEDESMQLDAAEAGSKALELAKREFADELSSKKDEAAQKGGAAAVQLRQSEELAMGALREQQAKEEEIVRREAAEQREKVKQQEKLEEKVAEKEAKEYRNKLLAKERQEKLVNAEIETKQQAAQENKWKLLKPPVVALAPAIKLIQQSTITARLNIDNYNDCTKPACLIEKLEVQQRSMASVHEQWDNVDANGLGPKGAWLDTTLVREELTNITGQHVGTNLTVTVRDLMPYQMYQLRMRAHNKKGWGKWSLGTNPIRTGAHSWKCSSDSQIGGTMKVAGGSCAEFIAIRSAPQDNITKAFGPGITGVTMSIDDSLEGSFVSIAADTSGSYSECSAELAATSAQMFADAMEAHASQLEACETTEDPSHAIIQTTKPVIKLVQLQQQQIVSSMKAAYGQVSNLSVSIADDVEFQMPEGTDTGAVGEHVLGSVESLRVALGHLSAATGAYKHLQELEEQILTQISQEWICSTDAQQSGKFWSQFYHCASTVEYGATPEAELSDKCRQEFRTWTERQAASAVRQYGASVADCTQLNSKVRFTQDLKSAMHQSETQLKMQMPIKMTSLQTVIDSAATAGMSAAAAGAFEDRLTVDPSRLAAQCGANPEGALDTMAAALQETNERSTKATQEKLRLEAAIKENRKQTEKAKEKNHKLQAPPPPPHPWKCKLCITNKTDCGDYCEETPWGTVLQDLETTREKLKLAPGEGCMTGSITPVAVKGCKPAVTMNTQLHDFEGKANPEVLEFCQKAFRHESVRRYGEALVALSANLRNCTEPPKKLSKANQAAAESLASAMSSSGVSKTAAHKRAQLKLDQASSLVATAWDIAKGFTARLKDSSGTESAMAELSKAEEEIEKASKQIDLADKAAQEAAAASAAATESAVQMADTADKFACRSNITGFEESGIIKVMMEGGCASAVGCSTRAGHLSSDCRQQFYADSALKCGLAHVEWAKTMDACSKFKAAPPEVAAAGTAMQDSAKEALEAEKAKAAAEAKEMEEKAAAQKEAMAKAQAQEVELKASQKQLKEMSLKQQQEQQSKEAVRESDSKAMQKEHEEHEKSMMKARISINAAEAVGKLEKKELLRQEAKEKATKLQQEQVLMAEREAKQALELSDKEEHKQTRERESKEAKQKELEELASEKEHKSGRVSKVLELERQLLNAGGARTREQLEVRELTSKAEQAAEISGKQQAKAIDLMAKLAKAEKRGDKSGAEQLEREIKASEFTEMQAEAAAAHVQATVTQEVANKAEAAKLRTQALQEAAREKAAERGAKAAEKALAAAEAKEQETRARLAESMMDLESNEAGEEHTETQLEVAQAKSDAYDEQTKSDHQQLQIIEDSKKWLQAMIEQKEDRAAVIESLEFATRAAMVSSHKADDAKAVEKPDLSEGIEAQEAEIEKEEQISIESLPALLHREKLIAVEIEFSKATAKRYKEETKAATKRHKELVQEGEDYLKKTGLSLTENKIMVDEAVRDADAAEVALAGTEHKVVEQSKALNAVKEKIDEYSTVQVSLHKQAAKVTGEYQARVESQLKASFKLAPAEEAAAGAALTAFNLTERAAKEGRTADVNSAVAEAEGQKQVAVAGALMRALEANQERGAIHYETVEKQAELATERLRQAELDLQAARAEPPETDAGTSERAQESALQLNLQKVSVFEHRYELEKHRALRAEETKIQSKAGQVQLSQTLQQIEVAKMALSPLIDAAEENKQEAVAMTKDIEASLSRRSSELLDTFAINLQQCQRDQVLLYNQLVHIDVKASVNQVVEAASRAAREAINVTSLKDGAYPATLTLTRLAELKQQDQKLEAEVTALIARSEARHKECAEMDSKRQAAEEAAADAVWVSALDALNSSLAADNAQLQASYEATARHNISESMQISSLQIRAIDTATITATQQSAVQAAQLDQREEQKQVELQRAVKEQSLSGATHSSVAAYDSRRAQLIAAANVDRAHEDLASVVAKEAELRGRLLALGNGKKTSHLTFSRLFPLMHHPNASALDSFVQKRDTQHLNAAKLKAEYVAQQSENAWHAVISKGSRESSRGSMTQFQHSVASYALVSLRAVRVEARERQLSSEYKVLLAEVEFRQALVQECERNEQAATVGLKAAAQVFASLQQQRLQVLTDISTKQQQQLKAQCAKARQAASKATKRASMVSELSANAEQELKALRTQVSVTKASNSKALETLVQTGDSTPAEAAQADHLLSQIDQVSARYLTAYLSAQEHLVSTVAHETDANLAGVQWQDQKAAAKVAETTQLSEELQVRASASVQEASTITSAQLDRVTARVRELQALANTRSNAQLSQVRKKAYNATSTQAYTDKIKKQSEAAAAQLAGESSVATSERFGKYQAAKEAMSHHRQQVTLHSTEASVSALLLAQPSALSATTMGTTWDAGPSGSYQIMYKAVREREWREGGVSTCSGSNRVQYCTQGQVELEETAPSVLGKGATNPLSLKHEEALSLGPAATTTGLWPGCPYQVKVQSPDQLGANHTAGSTNNATNSTDQLEFKSIAQRMPQQNWTCSSEPTIKGSLSLGGMLCSAFVSVEAKLHGAAGASWVGAYAANPVTGSVSGAFGSLEPEALSVCQQELHTQAAQLIATALVEYSDAECDTIQALAGLREIETITTAITEGLSTPQQLQKQAQLLAESALEPQLLRLQLEPHLPDNLKAAMESSRKVAKALAEPHEFENKTSWVCPEHPAHSAHVEVVGGCSGLTALQVHWKGSDASSIALDLQASRLPQECIVGAAMEAARKFGARISASETHCEQLILPGPPTASTALLAQLADAVNEANGVAVDLAVCSAASSAITSMALPMTSNSYELAQMAQRAVSQFVGQARGFRHQQESIRKSKQAAVLQSQAKGSQQWSEVTHWACSSDLALSGEVRLRSEDPCSGTILLQAVANTALFNSADQKCRGEFQVNATRVFSAALRKLRTDGCPAAAAASNAAASAMVRATALAEPTAASNDAKKAHAFVAKVKMVAQRIALHSMAQSPELTKPIQDALHAQATAEKSLQPDPLDGDLWSCTQYNSSQVAAVKTTHGNSGVWVSSRDRMRLNEKCRLQLLNDVAKQFSESLEKLASKIEEEGLHTTTSSVASQQAAQAVAAAAEASAAQSAKDLISAKRELQQVESVMQQSSTLVKASLTLRDAYQGKISALKVAADAQQLVEARVSQASVDKANWLSQVADERRVKSMKAADKKKVLQQQHNMTTKELAAGKARIELAQEELARTLQLATESDEQLVESSKQQGNLAALVDAAVSRWTDQQRLQHNATVEVEYLEARARIVRMRMAQVEQHRQWRVSHNLSEQLSDRWAATAAGDRLLKLELSRVAAEAVYEQQRIEKLQHEQEETASQLKSLVEQQVAAEHSEAERIRQEWRDEYSVLLREQDENRMAMENASVGFDVADTNTSNAAMEQILAEFRLDRAKINLGEHTTLLKALKIDRQATKVRQIATTKALDEQFEMAQQKHTATTGTDLERAPVLHQVNTNASGSVKFQIEALNSSYEKHQVEYSAVGSESNDVQSVQDVTVLTGLLPGVSYQLRVRVEIDGKWRDWSPAVVMEAGRVLWTCQSDAEIQASTSVVTGPSNVFILETKALHGLKQSLNRAVLLPGKASATVAAMFAPTGSLVDSSGQLSLACSLELQQHSSAVLASLLRQHATDGIEKTVASSTPSESTADVLHSTKLVARSLDNVEQRRLRTAEWQSTQFQELLKRHQSDDNPTLSSAVAAIGQAESFASHSSATDTDAAGVYRDVTLWACESGMSQQAEISSILVTTEQTNQPIAVHVSATATSKWSTKAGLPKLSKSCAAELVRKTNEQFVITLGQYTQLAGQASKALSTSLSVPGAIPSVAVQYSIEAFDIAVDTLQLNIQNTQASRLLALQEQTISDTHSNASNVQLLFEKAQLAETLLTDVQHLVERTEAIASTTRQQLREAAVVSRGAAKAASECTSSTQWQCSMDPSVDGAVSTCQAGASCEPRMSFKAESKPTTNTHCLNEFQSMAASHMADSVESLAQSLAVCADLKAPVAMLSSPAGTPTKQQQLWVAVVAGRATAAKMNRMGQMANSSSNAVLAIQRASTELQTAAAQLADSSDNQWVCTRDKSIRGAVQASSGCVAGVKVTSWSNLASKQSRACQLEFATHSLNVYSAALRNYSEHVSQCDPMPAAGKRTDAFRNRTVAVAQSFGSSAAALKQVLAHRTQMVQQQLTLSRKRLHTAEHLAIQTKGSAAELVGQVPSASRGLVKAQEQASELTGLLQEIRRKVNKMDSPHAVEKLQESVEECKSNLETSNAEHRVTEAHWERAQSSVDRLRDKQGKGPPTEKFEQAASRQREITELFRAKLELAAAAVEQAALSRNSAHQQSAQLALQEQKVLQRSTFELRLNTSLTDRVNVAAAAHSKVEAAGLRGAVAHVLQSSKAIEVVARETAVQRQGSSERQVRRSIAQATQRQEIVQEQQILQMKADVVAATKKAAVRAEREASMRTKMSNQIAALKKVSGIKIDIIYNDDAMKKDHRQTRILTDDSQQNHESLQLQLSNQLKVIRSLSHEMNLIPPLATMVQNATLSPMAVQAKFRVQAKFGD